MQSLDEDRRTLAPVFAYIDTHADEFVSRLRDLCRQPSVSAQNLGLAETADMVEAMANAVGAHTERIPLDGGPPIVYGRTGHGGRTLQWYDHYDVQPPGDYRRLFGVSAFLNNWDGREARRHYLFDPTCTICGLTSGYQGPGGKTVLPAAASAKIDFRLVPDQDPEEILSLLRRHLDQQGFSDVEVVEVEGAGERAARTDPDASIVPVVVDSARELYGSEPLVLPNMAGTGPQYLLCAQFGVPAVGMGVGNAESNNHAPDENIFVSDYVEGIKHAAWVMHRFAQV